MAQLDSNTVMWLTAVGTFVAGYLSATLLAKPKAPAAAPVPPPSAAAPPPAEAQTPPIIVDDSEGDESDDEDEGPAYKMVFLVRNDLKMTKGKVGHATLGAFKKALKKYPDELKRWERQGQAKVALKIDSEESLDKYQKLAAEKGLNTYVVADAGRTQIAAGSRTVLAIGPAPVSEIDSVTGKLSLL